MPNNLFATTFPPIFFSTFMYNDVREFYIQEHQSGYYQRRRNPKGFLTVICVRICVYVLLCVIVHPFHVPCTICKYLGLVVTILNYIAGPLTLSTKDFLSHLFTMQSDVVICSLNVRGLSNDTKWRETFLWLKKKKCSIYFLPEVHTVQHK